jgi:hypothetical protein
MDVHVDEPRSDDETGGIEGFSAIDGLELAGSGDFGHAAVLEENVFEGVNASGWIN